MQFRFSVAYVALPLCTGTDLVLHFSLSLGRPYLSRGFCATDVWSGTLNRPTRNYRTKQPCHVSTTWGLSNDLQMACEPGRRCINLRRRLMYPCLVDAAR